MVKKQQRTPLCNSVFSRAISKLCAHSYFHMYSIFIYIVNSTASNMAAISRWPCRTLILQIAFLDSRKLCQKCQNITQRCIVMFQIKIDMDPFDMISTWRLFQYGVWRVTISRSVTGNYANFVKFSTVIKLAISNKIQVMRYYNCLIRPRFQDGRHFSKHETVSSAISTIHLLKQWDFMQGHFIHLTIKSDMDPSNQGAEKLWNLDGKQP